MPLILIADDDRALVEVLTLALAQYQTCNASDGASILQRIATEKPDLVLLDLGLPDVDGGVLISKIRQTSKVPIIILSVRHEQVDKVQSLQLGADDYVTKPFDLDNLEARIEAVLRRCSRWATGLAPLINGPQFGTLSMKTSSRSVWIDGKPFHVTPTEFAILAVLITGETVSHAEMATAIWGQADAGTVHPVDTHISRLRARLAARPGAPRIMTARMVGFRLQSLPDL